MSRRKGKRIGKSVLGKTSAKYREAPTPEELEEIREQLREQKEEEKAEKLKGKEALKETMPEIPGEPNHKPKLIGLNDIDKALKKEGVEIEAKEVKDKRLKKKRKVRVDIKEIKG